MVAITSGIDTGRSSKLNTNFGHNFTHGATSTLEYTTSVNSTHSFITSTGYITRASAIELKGTVYLISSLDGVLDSIAFLENSSTTETRNIPFTLTYGGTLSLGSHTLTTSVTGGGSVGGVKMNAIEFL
jgi:hypothetical protein